MARVEEKRAANDVVPELPRHVVEQPKLLEVLSPNLEYVICAVDLGSTNPKVEVWIYDPKTKTFEQKDIKIEWGNYKTLKDTVAGTKIKYLNHEHAQQLLSLIKQQVAEALAGEAFNQDRQLVLAVTGFTHSLCITDHESKKTAVILDDPTPHPKLNREQKKILRQQLARIGIKLEDFIDKPTTLGKILWLMEHPQALNQLFEQSEQMSLKQVSFTVIRSLIVSSVLENKAEIVPSNEKGDFAVASSADLAEIAAFFEQIGLQANQALLAYSQLMTDHHERFGNVLTYDEKDLQAELTVLAWAIKYGKIDPRGSIIAADSVGKMIFDTNICPNTRSRHEASGTSYDTQRMLANINREWMGPLVLKDGESMNKDTYKEIDRIIKDLMDRRVQTPYIYIPTEKGKGMVFKLENGQYTEQRRTDIKNWSEEEKQLVMLAVAKGAFFGIRQKIEHIRTKNEVELEAPVYFYGGLLGHPQEPGGKDGWQAICIGAMPEESEVYEIDLPSGATAVAFCALQKLLGEEENKAWQKKFKMEISSRGKGGALQSEYDQWLTAQRIMIEKQQLLKMERHCKIVKNITQHKRSKK